MVFSVGLRLYFCISVFWSGEQALFSAWIASVTFQHIRRALSSAWDGEQDFLHGERAFV
jgi:uncharacterized BrkB/YihY/UPF0761 family membrane protein